MLLFLLKKRVQDVTEQQISPDNSSSPVMGSSSPDSDGTFDWTLVTVVLYSRVESVALQVGKTSHHRVSQLFVSEKKIHRLC